MAVDLTKLRNELRKRELSRSNLDDDPVKQFLHWFTGAIDSGIVEPSAMSLATTDESEIGIRTVLLKYFDDKGFVFYTNYESNKSRQIETRPEAALLFPWLALERQIKIVGSVEKVSSLESINILLQDLKIRKSVHGRLSNPQQFLLEEYYRVSLSQ